MHLTHEEHSVISAAIAQSDSIAQVYLFGSRVNNATRRQDIDLPVLSK